MAGSLHDVPLRIHARYQREEVLAALDYAGRLGDGAALSLGASTVLLVARERKTDECGTAPYLFLGVATYAQHTGERPIAITWKLEQAMPTDFFASATVAAG